MDSHVPKRLLEALGLDCMSEPRPARENPRAGKPLGGGVPGSGRIDLPATGGGEPRRDPEAAARAAQTKRDAITAGRIALLQALALADAVRLHMQAGRSHGQAAAMLEQTPQAVRRAMRLVHKAAAAGLSPKVFYAAADENGRVELMTLMEAELVAGIRDLETGHRLAEYAE